MASVSAAYVGQAVLGEGAQLARDDVGGVADREEDDAEVVDDEDRERQRQVRPRVAACRGERGAAAPSAAALGASVATSLT